jgi:thiol-disulfide isomerase/thioredoxin
MREFGVPARLATSAGTLLPAIELAVAATLVLRPSARWGAIAALALLLLFIAGIANALRKGQTPDCHCFGTIQSEPVGLGLLARNSVLAAVAAFVVVRGPGPALDAWLSDRSGSQVGVIGVSIVALVLTAVVVWLWRENQRLRRELSAAVDNASAAPGLKPGSPAPGFTVTTPAGDTVTLDGLRSRGLPIALAFVNPGCGPCEALLPDLDRWRETVADRLVVALIGTGAIAQVNAATKRHGTRDAAMAAEPGLEQEWDDLLALFAAYRLRATPSAVIVSPDGAIASTTVDGRPAIEALLRTALAGSEDAARATVA